MLELSVYESDDNSEPEIKKKTDRHCELRDNQHVIEVLDGSVDTIGVCSAVDITDSYGNNFHTKSSSSIIYVDLTDVQDTDAGM